MFSKVVGMVRSLGGWRVAGVDKNGNKYFCKPEKGGRISRVEAAEKRWVEFKGHPDPSTVPVEWNSWLSGTRKLAPTPQEMLDLEAQRKNMKLQAAILQKEDEKQRFKARASQQSQQADDGNPNDINIIMRQIGSEDKQSSQPEEPSHTRYTKGREGKESAEPTTWQPPRRSST